MHYLEALKHFHDLLRPVNYVEIGCRKGASLARARCPSLAIDPDFSIEHPLQAPTRIFKKTSDAFFRDHDLSRLLGGPVDLAFIDGMHKAEFALRDFLNLERHAAPGSVILVDDILPEDIRWATRECRTQAWTGDVYKLIPFLRETRPDLSIEVFDIEMKGLAVISGLAPQDRCLWDALERHETHLSGAGAELGSVEAIRAALAPRPAAELKGFARELACARAARPSRGAGRPDRYLDLLKRSLLNEIYLDDELRLLYLRDCLDGKETFDYATYLDIRAERREAYVALQERRAVGQYPERDIHRCGFSHTMMGRKRLDSLHECLDRVVRQNVPGDLMECGVWRGGACIFMAGFLDARGETGRKILVADSFEGLPAPSLKQDVDLDLSKERFPELAVALDTVKENFAVYGLSTANVVFLKGWFGDTLPTAPTDRLALLRLDGDLYESTVDALTNLYDRVSPGGIVIIDDYALKACRQAVEDFFDARGEALPALTRIDWTGAFFTKPARFAGGA